MKNPWKGGDLTLSGISILWPGIPEAGKMIHDRRSINTMKVEKISQQMQGHQEGYAERSWLTQDDFLKFISSLYFSNAMTGED